MMPVKFGISFNLTALNQAGALVHVYQDGSVFLNHGGTEMGQGLFVKVAQVVAEVFQIDLDMVRISATATGKVPNTSATAASTGSDLNGMAAFKAATAIKSRMTKVAAEHYGFGESEIIFRGSRVYAGNESMSFGELAKLTWSKRVQLGSCPLCNAENPLGRQDNARPPFLLFHLWCGCCRSGGGYADR